MSFSAAEVPWAVAHSDAQALMLLQIVLCFDLEHDVKAFPKGDSI
jgi:hypothetical protein